MQRTPRFGIFFVLREASCLDAAKCQVKINRRCFLTRNKNIKFGLFYSSKKN
jgi:hypothetical protein